MRHSVLRKRWFGHSVVEIVKNRKDKKWWIAFKVSVDVVLYHCGFIQNPMS